MSQPAHPGSRLIRPSAVGAGLGIPSAWDTDRVAVPGPSGSLGPDCLGRGSWESWRERIPRGRIDQVVTAKL
jgi:hypothetical protein